LLTITHYLIASLDDAPKANAALAVAAPAFAIPLTQQPLNPMGMFSPIA